MTFFVTGAGPGKGADLGGIEGADQHCQMLAQRHGAAAKTWRAYLSTQEAGGKPTVNARDRIGNGPWQNFKGQVVATGVDDLHSDNNKLSFDTSLSERGQLIPGVGFAPNRHDVLTRSPRRAARSRPAKIAPAATGRAAPRARPWSAISTAKACAMMSRRGRGFHRIPRAGAVAARATSAAPVGTGCSTALLLSKAVLARCANTSFEVYADCTSTLGLDAEMRRGLFISLRAILLLRGVRYWHLADIDACAAHVGF